MKITIWSDILRQAFGVESLTVRSTGLTYPGHPTGCVRFHILKIKKVIFLSLNNNIKSHNGVVATEFWTVYKLTFEGNFKLKNNKKVFCIMVGICCVKDNVAWQIVVNKDCNYPSNPQTAVKFSILLTKW